MQLTPWSCNDQLVQNSLVLFENGLFHILRRTLLTRAMTSTDHLHLVHNRLQMLHTPVPIASQVVLATETVRDQMMNTSQVVLAPENAREQMMNTSQVALATETAREQLMNTSQVVLAAETVREQMVSTPLLIRK